MVQSPSSLVLYVNPTTGNDSAPGGQTRPYKTLTRALQQATAGTTIQLAAGTYSAASGERFPLVVPRGVTIVGREASKGDGILISGNGEYLSPSFAKQNVAIRPESQAQIRGVTITNSAQRGTGIWIESTDPIIANNTFINCGREGVFATGTATPLIAGNVFQQNAASGLSIVRNAKGEIRQNVCQKTGYGIAVSDHAAPLLVENHTLENRSGIVISGSARPVLRDNRIENNTSDGLVVVNNALPDLGKGSDPGGNISQGNGEFDLRNATSTPLLSVGNQFNPVRVSGTVDYEAVQYPAVAAATPPAAAPTPTPTPTPGPVRLSDIAGYWAEGFISGLVGRGVVSGFPDGTFRPEQNITRAQYAAILAQAFDLPLERPIQRFQDVPNNFWAAGAIAKAQQMGFISGFPDGTFRPNQNLTRIQTIVSLVGGLKLTGGNPNSLDVYRDRVQIPSYATNAVATATQKRMVVNHPLVHQLEPLVDITRAEVVAMIYQALVARDEIEAIASPFIVNPDASLPSFADIGGHWAEGFIRGLSSQGFISGFADGTFKPDGEMTRAQYAALLASTFNLPLRRPATVFQDVPANFWAADVIQKVYRQGLISGFGDGTFRPNQNILRLHVLLSLVSGLGLPAADTNLLNRYGDAEQLPDFARVPVASATQQRLVVNYPDQAKLNPNREATRGEVAAMVYQALVQSARSPAIDSAYIVDPAETPAEPSDPAPPTTATVVVDPGHGGRDPGAVGVDGLREKDVIFPIAQEVAALLQQQGINAVMTRTGDTDLDLAPRVAIAAQNKADVFVSIHANAISLSRPEVNGLETYHYPGSSSGAALAAKIQASILNSVSAVDRGVRQANFYVLRNTSMPAALVEVGFVTGRDDAANLAKPSYRSQLAKAIAQGTLQFLQQGE